MPTALVIDDEPVIASVIRSAVPDWQISCALTGLQALRILAEAVSTGSLPDVVVLDIRLPDIDGRDVLLRIRQLVPAVTVVPFTSLDPAELELRQFMVELGCAPLISKGISPAGLRTALLRALEAPPAMVNPGPALLRWACHHAASVEARARAKEPIHGLAVVASELSDMLTITALLRGIGITNPHICRHADELLPILARQRLLLVIAAADDLAGCSDYCLIHNLPVLVVVRNSVDTGHVLTLHDQGSQAYALNLICLNGDQITERLQTALQTIQQGGIYCDPHVSPARQVPATEYAITILEAAFPKLSPRLREVLALAALGCTTPEIARSMRVTEATVHKYWMRLCASTQTSRSTLTARATQALLYHGQANVLQRV